MFDWAVLPVMHQGVVDGCHWLLIRRCIDDPHEKAYYLVFAPPATTLQEMVWAIGARWHIEEDLEATKDLGRSIGAYEGEGFVIGLLTWRQGLSETGLPSRVLQTARLSDTRFVERYQFLVPALLWFR